MQPRPLHADGKVAPVIPRHRAGCASFRTRRGDICSPPGQRFPNGAQIGEPLRRARLDEHEHLFARIPEFPGHMQPHGSFQLAEHIALAHQSGARKRLLRRQIARGPLRLYASGFAHQLLADGAHRGLAFQTRRPFQPQQRVRRKRHRARTRAAVQQGFGRKSRRRQRLGQRRFRRFHRRGHARKRISRRLALPGQKPPALARLQSIRLADRARIFFQRAARISRRDRLKRGLPIRHAVPPSSAAPRRA